jgi:hypothetical protein
MLERLDKTTNELVNFLKAHTKPGDKVLSNTTHTRGPIFPAFLQLEILPPTPYLENYLLFHNTHSPFVRNARKTYLETLKKHPPRFIVATPPSFFFSGADTEPEFKPFSDWIEKHYRAVSSSSSLPDQGVNETFTVYQLIN